MNVFNNPYNEMLNPNVDFSDGYFDAIVNSIKNKGLLLAMLEKGKDDVALVGKDVECGILLRPQFDAIQPGMWIEVR